MGFLTALFFFFYWIKFKSGQGEVTPSWFKVNPLYKVKMDEAAYLVMPYFVLPKIGYC
jgi:hypothetical protein